MDSSLHIFVLHCTVQYATGNFTLLQLNALHFILLLRTLPCALFLWRGLRGAIIKERRATERGGGEKEGGGWRVEGGYKLIEECF